MPLHLAAGAADRPRLVGLLLVLVALAAACASPGPLPGQRSLRPAATATRPAATATPIDLPTAAPMEPTASPPPPCPAATPTRSGITIILLPSPFRAVRGKRIVYTVRTTARTACSITIGYADAPALSAALPNAGGDASWSWPVGLAAPLGTWPITVAGGTASRRTTVTLGG